ncbi:hypothetical protein [Sphingobacterium sp. MYb382]|uniref:hypothetical protein n=1 Tax=Sphingobacterium sp. MYb382 TaxID=2745278 RepID=UPI0030B0C0BC
MGKIVLILFVVIGVGFLLLKIASFFLSAKFRGSTTKNDEQALLQRFTMQYYRPGMADADFVIKLKEIVDPNSTYADQYKKIAQDLLNFREEEEFMSRYIDQDTTQEELYAKLQEIAQEDSAYTVRERIIAGQLTVKFFPNTK